MLFRSEAEIDRPAAVYNLPETKSEMLKDAPMAGIMYDKELDEDIRSLRQTILYGLKGISAYGHQARELGYYSTQVDDFYIYGLEALTDDALTVEELIRMTMRTGEMALEVMKQLDEANTSVYGNPYPHKVSVRRKKGPFIIVSGHDFKDLEMLLEQTKGTGINIYTHGEMLPGHGYEGLKKYPHLVGNFGGAWQDQQKEFDNLPGCILMTTNCLMRPREGYKDRIYSTNVVGWEGVKYIPKKENGEKDFHEIIEQALALGGFSDDEEEKEITVGFAHQAVLTCAEKIVEAVKDGTIRHFFLIGGCDGARPGRNYYTEFAKMVPQDCVILTLACGKYRFNKLDFGEIAGLPRPGGAAAVAPGRRGADGKKRDGAAGGRPAAAHRPGGQAGDDGRNGLRPGQAAGPGPLTAAAGGRDRRGAGAAPAEIRGPGGVAGRHEPTGGAGPGLRRGPG